MKSHKEYTLMDLTAGLDVQIKGDPHCLITGISPIQQSQSGHITFLTNSVLSSSLYRKYLAETKASAVILTEADASNCKVNAIISADPYFTYAKIAAYFSCLPTSEAGIHASAVIGKNTKIDPTACIAANCVIGDDVIIAAHVVIGAGSVLGNGVEIGEATKLDANVTLYHHVKIGARGVISSGVVIGSDGFGFANQKGVWHKVPQLGSVQIGDDVEIGANTTIDRGAIENTVIGNGVKLDNQIQIGHNVVIGDHTIIAGCVGIAGSAVIGKYCMIGGRASIIGHISICDRAIITAATGVNKSITEPGMYSSGIVGVTTNEEFRKNNARFHRLDNLVERVKKLETIFRRTEE